MTSHWCLPGGFLVLPVFCQLLLWLTIATALGLNECRWGQLRNFRFLLDFHHLFEVAFQILCATISKDIFISLNLHLKKCSTIFWNYFLWLSQNNWTLILKVAKVGNMNAFSLENDKKIENISWNGKATTNLNATT